MKVIEIFNSVEGEGIRAGQLSTFIRFQGCNLNCAYCDTKYAQTEEGIEMDVEDILSRVRTLGCRNITLTGGEPLLQEDILKLISELVYFQHNVNVETNGSINVFPILDQLHYTPQLLFTVDYKCPCSGCEEEMCEQNFIMDRAYARQNIVYKFVVRDREDLDRARVMTRSLYKFRVYPEIYISPVYGQIDMREIVSYMKEYADACSRWRLQVQLHKIIWDPEERGV